MDVFWLIIAFGIVAVVVANSLARIPKRTIAMRVRFGGEIQPGSVRGGLRGKLPFIESFPKDLTFSTMPETMKISVSFPTSGNDETSKIGKKAATLIIELDTTVRLRVDPDITYEKPHPNEGVLVFSEWAPKDPSESIVSKAFKESLEGIIKSELGRYGGLHIYKVFIENRRSLEHYMNSVLRLGTPPHVNPRAVLEDYIDNPDYKLLFDGLEKEFDSTTEHPEVSRKERLKFYERFSGPIGDLLRSERENELRSADELLHGIDLMDLTIDNVGFDEESKQALQREAQALATIKGQEHYYDKVKEMMDVLESKGLDADEAAMIARVILGLTEEKVFTIPGLKDLKIRLGR